MSSQGSETTQNLGSKLFETTQNLSSNGCSKGSESTQNLNSKGHETMKIYAQRDIKLRKSRFTRVWDYEI